MKIAIKLFSLIFFTTICFLGCSKNNNKVHEPQAPEIPVAKVAAKLDLLDEETKNFIQNKTLVVVLGHSYNDEETVAHFKQILNENYGLKTEESEGLISLLVYPQDFMVAGKERVSSLYSKLEDENLAGIITFGAPEGLCNALARLEDLTEKREYPVFAFFQQDDVLGEESTADFVLDYVPQNSDLEEETASIADFDVDSLLINSIDEMLKAKTSIKSDKNLLKTVQKIAGSQKKVTNFSDYETGLKSINHFIFE